MSRAPAAALICLAEWLGEGREAEAVNAIKQIRPGAVPHVGLVRIADQLMNRSGSLVRALQALRTN